MVSYFGFQDVGEGTCPLPVAGARKGRPYIKSDSVPMVYSSDVLHSYGNT